MEMEYFTDENIKKINFKNPKEADETLRAKAQESGFELAAKDPIFSGYCRYYCTKGGKKRGQASNKTDCPFYFRTILIFNQDGSTLVKISNSRICLEQ